MKHTEAPPVIDWITVMLRWLVLLAIVVVVASSQGMNRYLAVVILVGGIWNIGLNILTVFDRRLPIHPYINVIGDLILAGGLFFFSGGTHGGIAWIGILPLLSAALYFHIRGVLLVTLINLLAQGMLELPFENSLTVLVFLGSMLPIYLGIGLPFGWLSQRMGGVLERIQRAQIATRREAERGERERSRLLYKLISALNTSLNYQRVLETALDLGYSTMAAYGDQDSRMVSGVLLYTKSEGKEAELHVGAARRFTPADLRVTLPGTSGLIGQAIDTGESKLGKGLSKDPELGRIVALRACRSAYCIPLKAGLDTYGVLLFAHQDENYFTVERREILDIIGSQSMVALQNARLYHELEQEKERVVEIQEEARKKLARDLHDGPTQSVAAMAMRVNFARRLLERDAKAAAEELYKIEDLARRTTKEIRHMLFTLRPLVLESQGLSAALESMAEKMHETYSQNVKVDLDPEVISGMEIGKQGVVFYIVEEAINNARKHAQAAHIWVRLKSIGNGLAMLEVEDDGVGFDVNAVDLSYEGRDSLGLVNMRERAELLNGVLQIDSAIGRGTRIKVIIPLTEEAADRLHRGL